ncbi:MAG: MmgE/PrpD family protein [Burkholderiaceae bacterium]
MTDATFHDPIERILDLIEQTRYENLPAEAVEAATVFFLDTVGVACAGKLAPKIDDLIAASLRWGSPGEASASIWNTGLRAPGPVAALINGYQCHALEYDCVYEPGVILPTPPIFGALMAKVDELSSQGRSPNGRDLIRAFVVALEVSCTLSAATRSAMFFFRPSTTGVFSALAALACLDPLPRAQLRHAFGIGYSQMCGPMQAHEEGSMMLAMQMGFAARNALQAHDMARVGITSPVELLGGRFGFFNNFEHEHDLPLALDAMGSPWKVTQLSHKPFPSGRVTHGVIHAMRGLRQELGLTPGNALDRIKKVQVWLPPLGMRLVGRPMVPQPAPNYARLCIPFVAAAEVIFGGVDPTTFQPERLGDPVVEALAMRVTSQEKPHPNPNAFYPQTMLLELSSGETLTREIPYAWGHPQLPLSSQEREDKFRLCWHLTRERSAAQDHKMERMIAWLRHLSEAPDAVPLVELLAATN